MPNDKKEYGYLTPEQAAKVWESRVKTEDVVKAPSGSRKQYSSTNVLSDPRMWPTLADILLMRDRPPTDRLDFDKASNQLNAIIEKQAAGNPIPPKPLGKGQLSKLALRLTRQHLAEALAGLELNKEDSAAMAKRDEARAILKKHGWREVAAKHKKKAAKEKKLESKPPGTGGTQSETQPEGANSPGRTPGQVEDQTERAASSPVQQTPATSPAEAVLPTSESLAGRRVLPAANASTEDTVQIPPAPAPEPIPSPAPAEIGPPNAKPAASNAKIPVNATGKFAWSNKKPEKCYYAGGFGKPHYAEINADGGGFDGKVWLPSQELADKWTRIMADYAKAHPRK